MNGNCSGFPGVDPDCETVGNASVRVTLTDEFGTKVPAATIAFKIDNSSTFFVSCTEGCENYPIVFNAIGRFNISVFAPGYERADRIVNVGSNDDCNPITQSIIIVLDEDLTVGALAGVWRAQTVFGNVDLRFGADGRAIGAILYGRVVSGDGNIYVSFNGNAIRGAPGQQMAVESVANPTRSGDVFQFDADVLGMPVGFIDAQMSSDFTVLAGTQPGGESQGISVTYARLLEAPSALQDP